MAVLPLISPDHPLLTTKMEPFDFKDPPTDVEELAHNMIDTMKELKGIGLSANQLGLPYRVFVMDSPTPFVCFNPRIVSFGGETVTMEEGCLSFPGLIVKVPRPQIVKVRFASPNGEVTTKTFVGMTSRCFQHELMHLDGKRFFEGVGRIKMEKALKMSSKFGFDYYGMNLMKDAVKKG